MAPPQSKEQLGDEPAMAAITPSQHDEQLGNDPSMDEAAPPHLPNDQLGNEPAPMQESLLMPYAAVDSSLRAMAGQAEGFGRHAIGGLHGDVYRVTTLEDDGPGSLRNGCRRHEPLWIVFDLSGTIRLNSGLRVSSYKTIDGRGQHVVLSGKGVLLRECEHVILCNLEVEGGRGHDADAVQIKPGSRHVWVDRCALRDFADGLLDVTCGSTDVTVSRCRFWAHDKAVLVGASSAHVGDRRIRVTIHHCFFDGTRQRQPRVRFARVHLYNNYTRDWGIYAVCASVESQIISQSNIYEAGDKKRVFMHMPEQDQCTYSDDIKYEEEFIVNSRGEKLFTCGWTPHKLEPKALIFICHGIAAECSVSMRDTASRLVRAGYAVYGIDHEGHGRSSGLRCYVSKFSDVVADCSSYFTSVCDKPENREKKRFLYGVSMGGSVALLLHRKEPAYWDGAVLLAPMCKISDDMKPHPVVVSVLKMVCAVAPSWRIIPTPDIIDKVCKDPEMRKQVRSNPYIYRGKIPLKTCHELLMVSLDIEKNLHEVTLPFLVLHGGDDIVTDPSASKLLFEEAASVDKTFKLYPGMWHALSAELPPDVEHVYSDIISWLDQRASRATCAANVSENIGTSTS